MDEFAKFEYHTFLHHSQTNIEWIVLSVTV